MRTSPMREARIAKQLEWHERELIMQGVIAGFVAAWVSMVLARFLWFIL